MRSRQTTDAHVLPPRESDVAAYRWLYLSLRADIVDGRLGPATKLPSTRELARQQGLARGTVVTAFEQLQAEGYVSSREGSGTFVAAVQPVRRFDARRSVATPPASGRRPARLVSAFAKRITPFPRFGTRPIRAFRTHLPAVDLFPMSLWAQVATRRVRRASVSQLIGCEAMGYRPLREVLAAYLGRSRGVHCSADQVAVVSGVQEALNVVSRLFINPGDRVCMEDPGYPGAARIFEAAGARIAAVRVDDEGMQVPSAQDCRLAYVTPAHQFPLGMSMTLARRFSLLAWAKAANALVVEDDYDSEYRYAERPLPALQGLDRNGVVIFTGSFSKILFPSIRLGYLVVPPDLVDRLAAALTVVGQHTPLLDQAILCDFITDGHLGRHLRRMRRLYAERLSTLLSCARKQLAGLLDLSPIEAGLQTTGRLRDGISGADAMAAAADHDVDVLALSRYARERMPFEGLLLGFAAVDAKEIMRGVESLAMALDRKHRRRTRPRN